MLDDEYAQETEVVDSVNAELKSLCLMECSVLEYIVKLRNYLPNLEVALCSVNGFEHPSAPTQVEYLVSKSDPSTLKDWDYFKAHNKGSTTYVSLPHFCKINMIPAGWQYKTQVIESKIRYDQSMHNFLVLSIYSKPIYPP